MNLLEFMNQNLAGWAGIFPQQRSQERAVTLAFGLLCGVGRRTVTRAIGFQGNTQKDWSADYKVFSRSRWEPRQLFAPILEHALKHHQLERVVVSADDTRVWRTGKHVPNTQWHRDPMGPPFHTNLRWGHRFLQASLVLPLYERDQQSSSRSIPIRFEMAPVVKKPGRKATETEWKEYERQRKEKNLSHQFVNLAEELRAHLDHHGHKDKPLRLVVDGSYCNRTVFSRAWQESVTIVARCRKDIVLCKHAQGDGRRFYGKTKFTPQMVREHKNLGGHWQTTRIFHGGCYREVRFKEQSEVYWQGGAKKQPVRLIVVAPVGYRTSKNGRKYYRQPAYLLTNDLASPVDQLIQDYFDRWGIEVNHLDEKDILGVGEAQVWNAESVHKVPALLVATYSWLLLGGLFCHGSTRTQAYEPLPKWRRGAKRPSCLDLITLLRKELAQNSIKFTTGSSPPTFDSMVITAAA